MNFYTVHEPPDGPADPIDRAETLKFIGDNYTKSAVVLGPFWLISQQLWLAFMGYVGIIGLVGLVVLAFGLSPRWIPLAIGALNIWLGFEGAGLQRWALARKGWLDLGTVSGRTLDEAERRFLESWLQERATASSVGGTGGIGGGGTGGSPIGAQLAAMADGSSGGRLGRLGGGGMFGSLFRGRSRGTA